MRLEPRVQLRPMDFSGGIGALDAAAGNKSRPPDGAVVAIAAFETAGAGRQPSFRAHKPEDWRRRAKCVRGMPDACKDNLELVSGEGVGGSWSLGPLRGNLADEQEKAFAAARTDPRTIRLFRVGGRIGGFRAHWGLSRCRLRVEAKQ